MHVEIIQDIFQLTKQYPASMHIFGVFFRMANVGDQASQDSTLLFEMNDS